MSADATGGGWRRLTVTRRVAETENVVSLHLAAADGAPLPPFRPGQFLTLRIADAAGRLTPRNYSLSSDPEDLAAYRITVRRHPHGVGSSHLHDRAPVGAILEATAPKGRFVLDETSRRPVLLLAGGIGVTPLAAMAQALARSGRDAHLIHAVADAAAQPLAAELQALAGRSPTFRLAAVPSRSRGRITADTLRGLLPIGDYDAYLCGPPGFMQAMVDLLVHLGVREDRIAHEFFGPARPLVRSAAGDADTAARPAASALPCDDDARPLVRFTRSGRSERWDGAHRTLLDFAEAHGLSPPFSCRNGICSTCLSTIDGAVRYIEEPLEEPGDGKALLCCSAPDGSIAIDI
jgi:uncharacterized protein